jgi:hypothetical protein
MGWTGSCLVANVNIFDIMDTSMTRLNSFFRDHHRHLRDFSSHMTASVLERKPNQGPTAKVGVERSYKACATYIRHGKEGAT